MIHCKEAVVVEGKYDRNLLRSLVDAPVFATSGFGVIHDKALLGMLRLAAERRGLIVLTDADGAGLVIRNYLKSAIPPEQLLHAYIPQLPGKERRKPTPGKEGLLGVEGMTGEVVLQVLRQCGATLDGDAQPRDTGLTKQQLYLLGLSGGPNSSAKRKALLRRLGLPDYLSCNAMLEALNGLYTKEELQEILESL